MALFDFTAFIEWFVAFVQAYGPLSVFVGVMIEEIIVPIPSPLILMTAGFILIPAGATLAAAALTAVTVIILPAAVATTLGSLIIYAVGHYGGDKIIKRFHRYLGTTVADVEKTGKKFGKGTKIWVTIALLRAIPIFPTSVVSLASGMLHLSWKKFAVATFIGALPRAFILALIGWQIGAAYVTIAEGFGSAETVILVAVLAAAALGFFLYVKKRKK